MESSIDFSIDFSSIIESLILLSVKYASWASASREFNESSEISLNSVSRS